MKVRKRLTYANVMSTLFVFLLVAGGTAVAAQQLGKKTVGSKQLKSNAVTTAKIKKAAVTRVKIAANAIDNSKIADNAVTGAKIADNAVTGAKIADGSVTGSDINASSASFSQLTTRLSTSNRVAIGGAATPYPIGTYTQNVGEDNQYLAALDVSFAATCTQPRSAQAYLLLDAVNPAAPTPQELIGLALLQDTTSGAVTRRVDFGPFPGTFSPMSRMSPISPAQHTFTVLLLGSSCGSGSGVDASGARLDVISTK